MDEILKTNMSTRPASADTITLTDIVPPDDWKDVSYLCRNFITPMTSFFCLWGINESELEDIEISCKKRSESAISAEYGRCLCKKYCWGQLVAINNR